MLELKAPHGIIKGTVTLTGSKSISNRLLVLKYLSGHSFTISNLSNAQDSRLLEVALKKVIPGGQGSFDLHHAGSSARFLTALLSTVPGKWKVTGSERLRQRPIKPLVDALKQLGADIDYVDAPGYLPLQVNGKTLSGGKVNIAANVSSQFISALLLISPALSRGIEIVLKGEVISKPYLDMTLGLLKKAGAQVQTTNSSIICKCEKVKFDSVQYVEGDWSAASYYYAICAFRPGSEIRLLGLNEKSLQGDAILSSLYQQFGVHTAFEQNAIVISSRAHSAKEFSHDFKNCPDIAQTLAVSCAGFGVNGTLSGLDTLKIKESDRIEATAAELNKMGIRTQTGPALLVVEAAHASRSLHTKDPVDTYNDHRMAMSFAALSLISGRLYMKDPAVVDKSYPAFWNDLVSLGFNVTLMP